MKSKNKLNIEIEATKDHEDSFWFDEMEIASMGKFSLVVCGEVKVVSPEGETLAHWSALEYAEEHKWTDKDLGKFEFDMNNWFEVQEEIDGYWESTEYIEYNYSDAIKMLKEAYENDRKGN